MKMNRMGCVAAAASLALAVQAEDPSEAARFGYVGEDLTTLTNMQYVVMGSVTNWVPERVLSVLETYELTADERRVVETAGTLMPSADYERLPEGFAKEDEGPWYTWWTRQTTSFGLAGKAGILTHYNEDRQLWESNESYFSSYWATEAEARAAQAKIRAAFAGLGAKRFHELSHGFLAEYVRLCVLCVVGEKADGQWSCMVDFRDKCSSGCGPWEPLDAQRERLAQYKYAKAMMAWNRAMAEVRAQNHTLISEKLAGRGLKGFGADAQLLGGNDQPTYAVRGETDPVTTDAAGRVLLDEVAADRIAALTQALGVQAAGSAYRLENPPEGSLQIAQYFTNDLFVARFDAFMPKVRQEMPEAEADEAEDGARPATAIGQWSILFAELLQPEIKVPEQPVLEK